MGLTKESFSETVDEIVGGDGKKLGRVNNKLNEIFSVNSMKNFSRLFSQSKNKEKFIEDLRFDIYLKLVEACEETSKERSKANKKKAIQHSKFILKSESRDLKIQRDKQRHKEHRDNLFLQEGDFYDVNSDFDRIFNAASSRREEVKNPHPNKLKREAAKKQRAAEKQFADDLRKLNQDQKLAKKAAKNARRKARSLEHLPIVTEAHHFYGRDPVTGLDVEVGEDGDYYCSEWLDDDQASHWDSFLDYLRKIKECVMHGVENLKELCMQFFNDFLPKVYAKIKDVLNSILDMFIEQYEIIADISERYRDILSTVLTGAITGVLLLLAKNPMLKFLIFTSYMSSESVPDALRLDFTSTLLLLLGGTSAIYLKNKWSGAIYTESLADDIGEASNLFGTIYDSGAVAALRRFVLACVSLKLFSKDLSQTIGKYVGKLEGKISIVDFVRVFFESLQTIMRTTTNYMDGMSWYDSLLVGDPVMKLVSDANALLRFEDRLYSGLPVEGMMSQFSYVNDLTKICEDLKLRKAGLNPFKSKAKMVTETIYRIEASLVLTKSRMTGSRRAAPLGVCLVGPPGIGKSLILPFCAYIWAKTCGRNFELSHIYNRVLSSDYWDGYNPFSQPYIHYSELGRLNQKVAQAKGDTALDELTSVIDGLAYQLNYSAVEDKGKYYARPDLVLCDTNNEDLNANVLLSNPAALMRRFVFIKPRVKDAFRKKDGPGIDDAKSLAANSALMDRWLFTVTVKVPLDAKTFTEKIICSEVDAYEFSVVMSGLFSAHMEKQNKIVAAVGDNKIYDEIYDAVCDNMSTCFAIDHSGGMNTKPMALSSRDPTIFARAKEAVKQFLQLDHPFNGTDLKYPDLGFREAQSPFKCMENKALASIWRKPRDEVVAKEMRTREYLYESLELVAKSREEDYEEKSIVTESLHDCYIYVRHAPLELWWKDIRNFTSCNTSYAYDILLQLFSISMLICQALFCSEKHFKPAQYSAPRFLCATFLWFVSVALFGFSTCLLIVTLVYVINSVFYIERVLETYAQRKIKAMFSRQMSNFWFTVSSWTSYNLSEKAIYRKFSEIHDSKKLMKFLSAVLLLLGGAAIGAYCSKTGNNKKRKVAGIRVSDEMADDTDEEGCGDEIKLATQSELSDNLKSLEKTFACGGSYERIPIRNTDVWNTMQPLHDVAYTGKVSDMYKVFGRNIRFVSVEYREDSKNHFQNTYIVGIMCNYAVINAHALGKVYHDGGVVKVRVSTTGERRDINRIYIDSFVSKDNSVQVGSDAILIELHGIRFTDKSRHILDNLNIPSSMRGNIGNSLTRVFSKTKDKIHMEDSCLGTLELSSYFEYLWDDHSKGKCGLPLFIEVGNGAMFAGIHSAGQGDGNNKTSRCFSTVLLRDEVLRGVKTLQQRSVQMPIVSEGSGFEFELLPPAVKSPFRHELLHGVEYYGKIPGDVMLNDRSKLVHHPFHGEVPELLNTLIGKVPEAKYVPPVMRPTYSDGVYHSPYNNGLLSMSRQRGCLNKGIVDKVTKILVKRITTQLRERGIEKLSPLDIGTAINGAYNDPFIRRINDSTSAGFGLSGKKRDYLEEGSNEHYDKYLTPNDELQHMIESRLSEYSNNASTSFIYKAHLKDEPRPEDKKYKTRIFLMQNLPDLVVSRMFLSPFYSLMVEHGDIFGTSVGINVYSDSDKLAKSYLEFSEWVMAGDYGKYDQSMPFLIGWAACSVVYQVLKEFGYNDEALKCVSSILTSSSLFPIYCMLNDLFCGPGMQPSGKYATAEDNSLRNLILFMYAWHSLPATRDLDFFEYNYMQTYGDDVVNAVKDTVIKYFNNVVYKKICETHYNMEYTDPQKREVFDPCVKLGDAPYLKRNFVYSEHLERYVMQLSVDSIAKTLTWLLPSQHVSVEAQTLAMFSSVLYELFLYSTSPVHYEKMRNAVIDMMAKYYDMPRDEVENGLPTYLGIKSVVVGDDA